MEEIDQVKIHIITYNQAFKDYGTENELARILRDLANKLESGRMPTGLLDAYGNGIGIVEYIEEEE